MSSATWSRPYRRGIAGGSQLYLLRAPRIPGGAPAGRGRRRRGPAPGLAMRPQNGNPRRFVTRWRREDDGT